MKLISGHIDEDVLSEGGQMLNYRAYFNKRGKADSITYYLSVLALPENGRYSVERHLISVENENQKSIIENALKNALKVFKPLPGSSNFTSISGYLLLKSGKKDHREYLNSLADTVSKISLNGYNLKKIPFEDLGRFKNLESLDLTNNYIARAKINKNNFPKLKSVSFQNNLLGRKSVRIKGGKIENLNLIQNYYSKVPRGVKSVDNLLLATNNFKEFGSKDIRRVKRVKQLNLYANQIEIISPKIDKLKLLEQLDLYHNLLTGLPERIVNLPRLKTLAVSNNKLDGLPAKLSNLSNLTTLYTHHNRLNSLPDMPESLALLDVGYNKIAQLSEQVSRLKNLESLDISNNPVSEDLNFLLSLKNLKEVFIFISMDETEEMDGKNKELISKLLEKGVDAK